MYSKTLKIIQSKVKLGKIYYTKHARKEMLKDNFNTEDIEKGIFSGKIVEKQRDRKTSEWKYKITGNSTQTNKWINIVVKNREEAVIITVFEEV